MEFISTQKYIRISPRKLREVADMVKPMSPIDAQQVLEVLGRSGAAPLKNALHTAVANASQAGVNPTDLKIKEIQIGDAPRLKRGRAGARGMWKPIKKRLSHIRIVLLQTPKPQKTQKSPRKPVISKSTSSPVANKSVKSNKKSTQSVVLKGGK